MSLPFPKNKSLPSPFTFPYPPRFSAQNSSRVVGIPSNQHQDARANPATVPCNIPVPIHPLTSNRKHDFRPILARDRQRKRLRPRLWVSTFNGTECLNQPHDSESPHHECELLPDADTRPIPTSSGQHLLKIPSSLDQNNNPPTHRAHPPFLPPQEPASSRLRKITHPPLNGRNSHPTLIPSSPSHLSGRKTSPSGWKLACSRCILHGAYPTTWPSATKTGDFPSGPPPVGRVVSRTAWRLLVGTAG